MWLTATWMRCRTDEAMMVAECLAALGSGNHEEALVSLRAVFFRAADGFVDQLGDELSGTAS
jgi:hypothetical protein